ncbi:MAG: hydantoinase B/oxoprolinase family protein, partial [Alcaligenaceae bacterium]|nr:hydantoinase B/oxoprolinase family protein [Alcaligenaceae bacterium]
MALNRQTHPGVLERDPVTFEVVNSALHAICAEMKSIIMRTSFSPLLSLSADLSCALLDEQCNVIAQGVDIPVHLGAARYTGLAALQRYPLDTWREGDGVLLNDPYEGGTHLPDMSLLTPIFSAGAFVGFVLSRIHWPDIGGIAAGSSSVSDEIIKEGLRIPPIKILEQGAIREDVLRLILANVRVPEDRKGDFHAALAGHARATDRVIQLCERYGVSIITGIMADTQVYSRRLVEAKLRDLPDTDVTREETLDGDGIDPDAAPRVRVNIRKTGVKLVFDFTGSSPCVAGPINAPLPVTASAVFYTVLSSWAAIFHQTQVCMPVSKSLRLLTLSSTPATRIPSSQQTPKRPTASRTFYWALWVRPIHNWPAQEATGPHACTPWAELFLQAAGRLYITRPSAAAWVLPPMGPDSTGIACIWAIRCTFRSKAWKPACLCVSSITKSFVN